MSRGPTLEGDTCLLIVIVRTNVAPFCVFFITHYHVTFCFWDWPSPFKNLLFVCFPLPLISFSLLLLYLYTNKFLFYISYKQNSWLLDNNLKTLQIIVDHLIISMYVITIITDRYLNLNYNILKLNQLKIKHVAFHLKSIIFPKVVYSKPKQII